MYVQTYLICQQKFKEVTAKEMVGLLLEKWLHQPCKKSKPLPEYTKKQGFQNICFFTKTSWYFVRGQSCFD